MYADRLEGEAKPSVRDRLNGNIAGSSLRRRTVTGKRQRQDDKWEHDLYEDEQPQLSRKLDGGDLRLKLIRKNTQQDKLSGGVRDLREKLSGSIPSQQIKKNPPKPKAESEPVKPARRSAAEACVAESKKVSDSVSRKKTQQKVDASVDGFLRSLDLEKYLITFQAEEVDMTALEHMTDDDLKAMGVPMGPRKKILLALNSRS